MEPVLNSLAVYWETIDIGNTYWQCLKNLDITDARDETHNYQLVPKRNVKNCDGMAGIFSNGIKIDMDVSFFERTAVIYFFLVWRYRRAYTDYRNYNRIYRLLQCPNNNTRLFHCNKHYL